MRARRLYRTAALLAGAASVAAVLAAQGLHLLRRLDLATVDVHFAIRGAQPPPRDIVVVKIDDVTFNELNQRFPFPRGYHAKVIDNAKRDGARVIAYDVQFTEPSDDPRQDGQLIEAVRRAGNAVLATTEVGSGGTTRVFGGGEGLRYSRGVAAESDFPNDPGGVVRRLWYRVKGLASFPVATVEQTLHHRIAGQGRTAWIDYRGPPGTIRSISFSRVALGRFRAGTFRRKIVVVGASAPSLQDRHPTSTTGTELMSGPEIQANAIDTALRGFPLRNAPGWLEIVLIAALGLCAPLAALRMSGLRALGIAALGTTGLAVASQIAFDGGRILGFVYPASAALLSGSAVGVLYGLNVAFERERVRDAFARFVPEAVVGQVLEQADGLRLGGVRREATVLFSDLRGFTSFAEPRDPDLVIEVLNRYLTEMSDAILDHGGTLVSYMGDGIMAVFGAPLDQTDHADRALAAAQEMLVRLEPFNASLRDEGHDEGFKMGIGLNSGPIMSGNVGSQRRLEYTAIGDTTNTAARLEGMTKGTPHQLFVADSTRERLTRPRADLTPVGELAVRGRGATIHIWTLADAQSGESSLGEASASAYRPD